MFHRFLPCLCLIVLCATVSFAQTRDYPKFDFAAGFSFNRVPVAPTHQNFKGFTAAVGWNFRRFAAVEGDVTYTTKTFGGLKRSLYSYLIGPRFTKRITLGGGGANGGPKRLNHPDPDSTGKDSKIKLEPYVHALFGGGHFSGFVNNNGWAGKMGGGLDIVVGKHFAVRAAEIDYYRYRGSGGFLKLNNALLTFGVRLF
jgi:hypothetical protein